VWAPATFLRVLLAACLGLAAPACVTNPATGSRDVILTSTEEENRSGEQAARQVEDQMGLVRAPALEAYVQKLGARLAANSPRRDVSYRFAIADMPETNAFALPGGYIYVSRGLLALANSEAELANVIGHEIGHVAARHHARQQTRATGVGILSALGTVAAAILGGPDAAQMVGAVSQVAGAGIIASYSREQERESDEIGQRIAAQSGYDPAAMADFLASLGRESEVGAHGHTRAPSFLDSHPATPERVGATRARAGSLQVVPSPAFARDRDAFLARLEGLMVGPDPAQGMFQGTRFLHADMDLHLRFPSDWRTQNAPSQVAAAAPQGDALLGLELHGRGDDPLEAARAFLEKAPLRVVDDGALRINGLRAYRVIGAAQDSAAHLTWIAYRGSVYRITGLSSPTRFRAYRALFDGVAETFRPLSAAERGLFKKRVLKIAIARPGETFEALGRRTGNGWGIEQTAVANGLRPGDPLPAGLKLKIAQEQPYQPRAERPGTDPTQATRGKAR
jgi:predicted Zn-dependent protease